MKAQLLVSSDPHATAPADGRGLFTAALQRNPLVALATALISPLTGLFRRRQATQIERLRLERYSSRPLIRPPTGHRKVTRRNVEGDPDVARSAPEAHPNTTRSRPEARPKNTRSALGACRGSFTEGGYRHG
jgi:hypothetical protein